MMKAMGKFDLSQLCGTYMIVSGFYPLKIANKYPSYAIFECIEKMHSSEYQENIFHKCCSYAFKL